MNIVDESHFDEVFSAHMKLPRVPGVYMIADCWKRALYAGKAACLEDEVRRYMNDLSHGIHPYVPRLIYVSYIDESFMRDQRERWLIDTYAPEVNANLNPLRQLERRGILSGVLMGGGYRRGILPLW